jgi:hypothetical protein
MGAYTAELRPYQSLSFRGRRRLQESSSFSIVFGAVVSRGRNGRDPGGAVRIFCAWLAGRKLLYALGLAQTGEAIRRWLLNRSGCVGV